MGERFIRSAFVILNNVFHYIRVDETGYSETRPENVSQFKKAAQSKV